jgi:SNF2 family DNA or RNA helicase
MGGVLLTLRDAGRRVQVDVQTLDASAAARLEHALLLSGAKPQAGGFTLPTTQFRRGASEIARLLQGLSVELDPGVEELLRMQLAEVQARQAVERELQLLSAEEVQERLRLTERFHRTLNARQLENLGRLLVLPHGANFSVPGAGKTSTLLAVYEILRGMDQTDRLLVVAPKNAFISWDEEVENCYRKGRWPVVRRLTGGASGVHSTLQENPEIALITYQLLPNVVELVKDWVIRHNTHIVLDESHRIKSGWLGVTASAALELADAAVRRDILSGTPLPQSPEDLRPQFEFLWPGQRILPDVRVLTEAPPGQLAEIERAVRPLYVRTTKEQLDLPKLHVNPRPVDLGQLQRELYDLLRSEAARDASGMRIHDVRFFRALGRHVVRLLQAAVNPMLLTQGELIDREALEPIPEGTRAWELLREFARYEQPAKVNWVLSRTEELINEHQKVLIWTQFVMNVRSLERLLSHHGAVVLYGQVPTGDEDDPETREFRIRAFHEDPDTKVMIANPAAAGEGISLHMACHHALYLDRSFNAAHYLQSVDRIHRLGSVRETEVEIPEAADTIDGRVAERLNRKVRAMSAVLDDPGLRALAYDPLDVQEEFAGGVESGDVEEILEHLNARPAH